MNDSPAAPEGPACCLCGAGERLTFHHLIPRACHSNKWFRKRFSREEMQNSGVTVCRGCHYFIHDHFSEKELGRSLNTLAKLKRNETVARYAAWAAKQQRHGR